MTGGIYPLPLRWPLGDDKAQTAAAIAVAEQFVADPQVLGVVGTMNSHTSMAAAPIYSRAGLAQLSPAASNPALTSSGFHTFFRLIPHDHLQGQAGARFVVKQLGARRIVVIHDGSSFAKPLAETFSQSITELGVEPLRICPIRSGQVDFRDTAAEVAATEPDLVFMGVIEAEGRYLATQLREAGVKAPYLGTDGLKPSLFLTTPAYDVTGPYHTSAATDVWQNPTAADFAKAYKARYGELYSIYTAEAYDGAALLIEACRRAESLSRAAVLTIVRQTKDFPGASGPLSFEANGERQHSRIAMYKIEQQEPQFLGYSDQ